MATTAVKERSTESAERTRSKQEITWETPHGVSQRALDVLETLKANPNQWARVMSGKSNSGSYGALQRTLKAGGCEAVARLQEDSTYSLFARFVAPGQ